MKKKTHTNLKKKKLAKFLSIEAWRIPKGKDDHGWEPDEEGDVLAVTQTEEEELSPWPHIKVEVREKTRRYLAVELLTKIIESLEYDWDWYVGEGHVKEIKGQKRG